MVRSVSHLNGLIKFLLDPELENLSQNLRVGASKRSRQNHVVGKPMTPTERFYPTRTGFANKLFISKFTRRSDRIDTRTQLQFMHNMHIKWSDPTPTTSGDIIRSNRVAFGRLSLKIRVRPTQNQKSKVEVGHNEAFWQKGFLLFPPISATSKKKPLKLDFHLFFTNRIGSYRIKWTKWH